MFPASSRLFCLILAAPFFQIAAYSDEAKTPAASAQIDAILQEHWKANGLSANGDAGDEVFLRRVFLDVAGRIPTVPEAQQFFSDAAPDKRAALIDRLLGGNTYVAAFYPFWADILRMIDFQPNTSGVSTMAYERFVKQSLRDNKPYDRFVRELLSAKGLAFDNGAVGYYLRDRGMPLDNMAVTTRIFLGTRIECAQCHDHPFDKWKQTDFYKMAAFTFGNSDRRFQDRFGFFKAMDGHESLATAPQPRRMEVLWSGYYHIAGQWLESTEIYGNGKEIQLPHDFREADGKPHEVIHPAPLFGSLAEAPQTEDRALTFARWVTAPENPRFTRVIVNRFWKKLFGAPLTNPYDALTDTSKSAVPELESFLQKVMVDAGYDMKAFLKVLLNTRAYQAVALREEPAPGTQPHFQGPFLRRMTPEQIWDSFVALVNHEPEVLNFKRTAEISMRIRSAKTVNDAYEAVGVNGVIDLALGRVEKDHQFTKERAELLVQMEAATRNGDSAAVEELKKAVAAREAQWEREKTETFVMPLLESLAKKAGGKDAKPVLDELYPQPSAPYARQAFTRFYPPGDALAPKTKEQLAAEQESRKARWLELGTRLGISDKDRPAFTAYCESTANQWIRAAGLGNPAPRGHFLREMGQSDRQVVENANMNAGMPQALLLMNSQIASTKGVLARFSPLMQHLSRAPESERLEAACLALFSRKPTAQEREVWQKANQQGAVSVQDLIFALLNAPQFLFIE